MPEIINQMLDYIVVMPELDASENIGHRFDSFCYLWRFFRYPFVCNEILSSAEAGILEAFFEEGESSSDEEDS